MPLIARKKTWKRNGSRPSGYFMWDPKHNSFIAIEAIFDIYLKREKSREAQH